MLASGLHRDLFQSVYNYCIDSPIKSSLLCDQEFKRYNSYLGFSTLVIYLYTESYFPHPTPSQAGLKKFNIFLKVRSTNAKRQIRREMGRCSSPLP